MALPIPTRISRHHLLIGVWLATATDNHEDRADIIVSILSSTTICGFPFHG